MLRLILLHHPHLLAYFRHHPVQGRHFVRMFNHHPELMGNLIGHSHYCQWLLAYLHAFHRLPGIDLLLGA